MHNGLFRVSVALLALLCGCQRTSAGLAAQSTQSELIESMVQLGNETEIAPRVSQRANQTDTYRVEFAGGVYVVSWIDGRSNVEALRVSTVSENGVRSSLLGEPVSGIGNLIFRYDVATLQDTTLYVWTTGGGVLQYRRFANGTLETERHSLPQLWCRTFDVVATAQDFFLACEPNNDVVQYIRIGSAGATGTWQPLGLQGTPIVAYGAAEARIAVVSSDTEVRTQRVRDDGAVSPVAISAVNLATDILPPARLNAGLGLIGSVWTGTSQVVAV